MIKLNVGFNQLQKLPKLSDSIEILHIESNRIEEIEYLPQNLRELLAHDNNLHTIKPELPPGLKMINVDNNDIDEMFELPTMIEEVSISNNKIAMLTDVPDSVTSFDCSNNYLTEIPLELEIRNKLSLNYKNNYMSDNNTSYEINGEQLPNILYNNNHSNVSYNPFCQNSYNTHHFTTFYNDSKVTDNNPYYIKNTNHISI